jgi:hypothetical protein
MDVQADGVSATDREAIRATATDYIESWLLGDGGRMARCLHPALAKRKVVDPAGGALDLHEVRAADLIDNAGTGPKDVATHEHVVTVLDVFPNIASVKVASGPFIDYLHLGRFGDRWLIVNALYEPRQRSG